MNNDEYDTLKNYLKHPPPLVRNYLKHPTFTQGELEPQFASKDSYFGQNIKKVFRSNWKVINHP